MAAQTIQDLIIELNSVREELKAFKKTSEKSIKDLEEAHRRFKGSIEYDLKHMRTDIFNAGNMVSRRS